MKTLLHSGVNRRSSGQLCPNWQLSKLCQGWDDEVWLDVVWWIFCLGPVHICCLQACCQGSMYVPWMRCNHHHLCAAALQLCLPMVCVKLCILSTLWGQLEGSGLSIHSCSRADGVPRDKESCTDLYCRDALCAYLSSDEMPTAFCLSAIIVHRSRLPDTILHGRQPLPHEDSTCCWS